METHELISPAEINSRVMGDDGHSNKKLCFIFGAGASYGYNKTSTTQAPPTVNKIFDEENNLVVREILNSGQHEFLRRQKNLLLTELAEDYGDDLERYLSEQYDRTSDDDIFSLLILYLQDICSLASQRTQAENHYRDLIFKLLSRRGKNSWSCLIFNYDTIFEQSYISVGRDIARNFQSIQSYTDMNPKIIKMHGSINFRFRFKEKSRTQRIPREIFQMMMSGSSDPGTAQVFVPPQSIIPKFWTQSTERPAGNVLLNYDNYDLPLMMIPIHATTRSENPFFPEMIDKAKTEIETSDLIIAIGYNFGDQIFTDSIKGLDLSKKELILVGTGNLLADISNHNSFKNASKIFKNIKIFQGKGFGEFVSAIMRRPANS